MSFDADTKTSASFAEQVTAVVHLAQRLLNDFAALLGLEARRAAKSLAGIVIVAIGAAFMLMATWLLAQATLVVLLGYLGVPLALTLLVLAILNGAATVWLLLRIRRLSRNLTFPELREALQRQANFGQQADRDAAARIDAE